MLNLGNSQIGQVFLGEAKIKKAFLGDELVYEGEKASRLPEGYKEVRYLDLSGNVGILLGIKINPTTFRMVMDLEARPYEKAPEYIMSCLAVGVSKTWICRRNASSIYYMVGQMSSEARIALSFPENARTTLDLDWANKKITIDGVSKTLSNTSYTTGSMSLFNTYSSTTGYCLPCKLYAAQIYKSGALQMDLVPCVRESDGEPGLYDLTAQLFHAKGDKNTGTITPGPAV